MKFETLGEKLDENHQETADQVNLLDRKISDKNTEQTNLLVEIKQQTMKTNGRVNNLELENAKRKASRSAILWTTSIITIITLPLIIYVWTTTIQTINDRIDKQENLIPR